MCDYSLLSLPNRLAREGEELVVYRFPSGSRGLASPADLGRNNDSLPGRSFWAALKNFWTAHERGPIPAVCIPPGARLTLYGISGRFRHQYRLQSEEEVIFRQLSSAANTYRDAIAFCSGLTLKLQDLPEGQRVRVTDLATDEAEVWETATAIA